MLVAKKPWFSKQILGIHPFTCVLECFWPKNLATLRKLISIKGCGPILIRLSWHDAGVFNGKDGCPNAAMRLAGGGEHAFTANAGLPQVAIPLLQAISDKYVPRRGMTVTYLGFIGIIMGL